jgi:hypothetical protein
MFVYISPEIPEPGGILDGENLAFHRKVSVNQGSFKFGSYEKDGEKRKKRNLTVLKHFHSHIIGWSIRSYECFVICILIVCVYVYN